MSGLAISYLRFSDPKQKLGDSKRRQVEVTAEFCRRHNLRLDDRFTFSDLGVSSFRGANRKKGDLSVFLEMLKDGKIPTGSTLVIESLDRLSRDKVRETFSLVCQILDAGVSIATIVPERILTSNSLDDTFTIMEVVMIASRGREESATKSYRLTQHWKNKRAEITDGTKMTSKGPAWLKLDEDRKTWEVVEPIASTIKYMAKLALEGKGGRLIAQTLNEKKMFTATGLPWRTTNVVKLLRDRRLIGEHTPHLYAGSGKENMTPCEPVADYYTPILTPETFARVQAALLSRFKPRGRNEARRINIFRGLVHDEDGQTFGFLTTGGRPPKLVPAGNEHGRSSKGSISYDRFEKAFLRFTSELKPEDIVGPSSEAELLAELSSSLTLLNEKIEVAKSRLLTEKDKGRYASLMDVRLDLEAERKKVKAEFDSVSARCAAPAVEGLADVQSIAGLLESSDDPEALRLKLRSRVRQLVRAIYCRVVDEGMDRTVCVEVVFPDDTARWFFFTYSIAGGRSGASSQESSFGTGRHPFNEFIATYRPG